LTGFKVDLADKRFQALINGDEKFALDPTHPKYKPTIGTMQIQQERQKRRHEESEKPRVINDVRSEPKKARELPDLLNSVKMKAGNFASNQLPPAKRAKTRV